MKDLAPETVDELVAHARRLARGEEPAAAELASGIFVDAATLEALGGSLLEDLE